MHYPLIKCPSGAGLHRTGPPLGLSRDLIIRALANQLQEQIHGRVSAALRRRLQTLAAPLARSMPVPFVISGL
jgi:hypothetical protein